MQVINRKGEMFNVDGDEVPDGCGLRTNIFMLDSGLDDTQREIARSFSRQRFTDGIGRSHQPGHRFINTTSSGVLQDAALDARDMAYAELEKRLAAAWRSTARVAALVTSATACAKPPTPGRPSSPAILLSPSLRNALRMPGEVADEQTPGGPRDEYHCGRCL